MRTFLIVDRLLNSDIFDRLLNSDKASSNRTEIFESCDYILRPEITKLMLGNLDRGEEIFRIRKIVNTSSQDVIDAFKLAFKIKDDFPKALAVYEEKTMETRE